MFAPSPSVQSPRAYDLANLTASQLATRLQSAASAAQRAKLRDAIQDAGYLHKIHPLETAAGLVDANLTFGFAPFDLARYGAVADGTTDDTTAITNLFTVLQAADFEGLITLPPNCKFVRNTVLAAIPTRAVLFDASLINAHHTSGFRQKLLGFVDGTDTIAVNDFQFCISSGHNACINLDNRGNNTSSSGQLRIGMLQWTSGQHTKGEPDIRALARLEFAKISGQSKWSLTLRRGVPQVAWDWEYWYTGTVYAAGATVISYDGSNVGRVYKTTLGGTTGATAPTHTSGTVSDGGVSWTCVMPNIDSSIFVINENGEIAQHTTPTAGVCAYFKADPDGPGNGLATLYVEGSGVSKTADIRLRPTDGAGTVVPVPYWQGDASLGARLINSTGTATFAYVTDTRGLELGTNGIKWGTAADGDTSPDVSGSIGGLILANTGATSVTALDGSTATQRILLFFENGNTTLVHNASTFVLKGAVNVTPTANKIMEFIKYPNSSAWFEYHRNF